MLYSTHNLQELIEAIRKRNVILFVGGGVSMNLGLPSWDRLIDRLAKDLGFDKDVFRSYGDHLLLAEYYKMNKGIGPLRSWMDRKWHNTDKVDIRQSRIHQLIVELDFPMIYTTNYDRWIEFAFDAYNKPYVKVADVSDIKRTREGVTQIVKFHGDFDNDNSIVLTESSYFDRLDFETPLDIKLRGDVLGRSILFIGYSLTDINIRFLLYKLNKMWQNAKNNEAKPKSFILLMSPNPVQEMVLEKRGIVTIISQPDDPGRGLTEFLDILYQETYNKDVPKPADLQKKKKKKENNQENTAGES
ncbi:MAG: SIR2 family protein [Bacteroidota bacterium]